MKKDLKSLLSAENIQVLVANDMAVIKGGGGKGCGGNGGGSKRHGGSGKGHGGGSKGHGGGSKGHGGWGGCRPRC